ncbi:MAG: stage II sporulation protein P [Terrisporobacter sp.]
MKVTTVFFKSNILNITSNIKGAIKSVIYVIYATFLVISFTFFLSKLNISSKIIDLASNIHINNNKIFSIADIKNIYPVFNNTSYYIKEKVKENIKEEVLVVNNENSSENEVLDNIKFEDAVNVFSNKKSLNINKTSSKDKDVVIIDDIKIYNYSSLRDIDYEAVYNKVITLTKSSDKILLYNTHTSESYTNSEKYKFGYSGTFRSREAKYNMLSVAGKLQSNLKEKGINSIHDTTPHDYGTYTSSYARSKTTIKEAIKKSGNFGISIDVHRDASGDTSFAPKTNINGLDVAQCMFVIGVGTNKNRNEYYEDNLALAIQMQILASKIYPGLFRTMFIRNSVYNQDLNKYSLLIEVGATGNTFDEAYRSTRCLSNLFNIVYKK